MTRVAVIGGGIAGLTCARALIATGIDAHVFEASARAGGVVETSRVGGFVREHAASSFRGGPPHGALALCGELGVAVVRADKRAKHRWIFIDGKLRELPRDPLAIARSDLLTWRGKLALVREPFAPRRRPGEDESVHAFAARRFGPEVARAIFAPFVTGVFAADSHAISLEAGFPALAALDDAGGIFRGGAKLAARAIASRLRSTGGQRTARGVFAPIGGVGALTDALADALGSRVRLHARVRSVAAGDRCVVVDGERWDAAVLATPATIAADLVAAASPELAGRLAALPRAAVATVFLGFPEAAVPDGALDGFGFLVARGEDLRVLGVVFESTLWPERSPAGHVLVRCIFGGGRDRDASTFSDEDLIDHARRDVETALGIGGEPSHASVVRAERGLAQYAIGHRDHVRGVSALARSRRIALAGADYRGAGVNDICADADVITAEVRSWL